MSRTFTGGHHIGVMTTKRELSFLSIANQTGNSCHCPNHQYEDEMWSAGEALVTYSDEP